MLKLNLLLNDSPLLELCEANLLAPYLIPFEPNVLLIDLLSIFEYISYYCATLQIVSSIMLYYEYKIHRFSIGFQDPHVQDNFEILFGSHGTVVLR